MIKRIKILLSILVLFTMFTLVNVKAEECGNSEYLYKKCVYMLDGNVIGKKKHQANELTVILASNGVDDFTINASIYYTGGTAEELDYSGYTISVKDGFKKAVKSGEEFKCINTVHASVDNDKKTFELRGGVLGVKGTLKASSSCSNGKPMYKQDTSDGSCYVRVTLATYPNGHYIGETDQGITVKAKKSGSQWTFEKDGQTIPPLGLKTGLFTLNYKTFYTDDAVKSGKVSCDSMILSCDSRNRTCTLKDSGSVHTIGADKVKSDAEKGDEYLDDMGDIFGNIDDPGTCDTLLDADAKDMIIKIFNWIRIITPILLILLGAVDFGKAMLASDDKQMAMAVRNFITRCIIALAIFFVPLIIYYFMDIIMKSTGIVDNAGNICKFL